MLIYWAIRTLLQRGKEALCTSNQRLGIIGFG